MSAALQVALFLASAALIALVACLIPIAFRARRRLEELVWKAGQLKADLDVLVLDSRALVRSVNTLVTRTNERLNDVEHVVRTVRQWTDRADRLVAEVGAAIEPPVLSLARNVNLIRTGVRTFLQIFLHRTSHNGTHRQTTEEIDRV